MKFVSSFVFASFLALLSPNVSAQGTGDWFFHPAVGVGANTIQGTYFRVGVDAGYFLDENLYAGVGGYYGAGQHPDHDREIGGGPFVGYVYPVVQFLSLQLREDILYVDERIPELHWANPDYYTHTTAFGLESATYAGAHFTFTRNFGFAVGYRLVVGLSNSDLSRGRSGFTLGFTIGI